MPPKDPGAPPPPKMPQDTPPEVIDELVKTMEGIAERNGTAIDTNKLRMAAMMVALGAEQAGEPLTKEEAVSPHSELMEKMKKAVEVRASM